MTAPTPPHPTEPAVHSRSRWIATSLVVAAVLALLGGLWLGFEQPLIDLALQQYHAPGWRRDLLRVRFENYGTFYLVASAAALVFAAALKNSKPASDTRRSAWSRTTIGIIAGIAIVGAAAAMYGLSTAEWESFGRPCWDGYCTYANRFRDVLFGDDPAALDRLLAFMRGNYHSNSPAGPVLTAIVGGTTGLATVTAYRAVVGTATFAAIACVWFGLLAQSAVSQSARAGALALLATHMLVIRSAFFPQTDALVLAWSTALLVVAWRRWTHPRRWHSPACFALLVSGLFVKLSFLPALALIPLWAAFGWIRPRSGATPTTIARVVGEGAVFALIPAAIYFGFQRGLGTFERFGHELSRTSTEDTLLAFVLMSLLHAALFSGLLIATARRRLESFDSFLLLWVALYLLSLWASGASGWDRFYLPIVPALTVVAARGLDEIGSSFGPGVLWSAVALIAGLNYAALALRLYY